MIRRGDYVDDAWRHAMSTKRRLQNERCAVSEVSFGSKYGGHLAGVASDDQTRRVLSGNHARSQNVPSSSEMWMVCRIARTRSMYACT